MQTNLKGQETILIVEDEYVIANDLRRILRKAGYLVSGIAESVSKAQEFIQGQKPDLVLLDIYLKGKQTGIDLARELKLQHIPFVFISAYATESILEEAKVTQPYGYLIKPFREKEILATLEIARYRYAHSLEVKLREEKSLQVALSDALSEQQDWETMLLKIAKLFQPHIPFDYLILGLEKEPMHQPSRACSFFRIGFDEYQKIKAEDFFRMTAITPAQYMDMRKEITYREPARYSGEDFEELCGKYRLKRLLAKTFHLCSNLVLPLRMARGGTFILSFFSKKPDTYQAEHLALAGRIEHSLALSLDRLLAFDEIKQLSEQLHQENTYLQEEVKTTANFEEIIGRSSSLLQVFKSVSQVAPTDTSVLILGESGTGKELFARAIHNLSLRKSKILVKVNCAALPANLIESELFGHEKGAFTGAIDKRIGKFELAQGGTIFLDEIGELPLDLQAKLLRVLQEKEIERIGGKAPIRMDVRIIAATNRNLEQEVTGGRFRLDLYYRLNVFPITLPALRDRKEDIALLAHFFAEKYSRKMGKSFLGIKEEAMAQLLNYQWPGNIRELENVIEQAVIINDGQSPLEWGRPLVNTLFSGLNTSPLHQPATTPFSLPLTNNFPAGGITLSDVKRQQLESEREYMLMVLRQTNGRIRGKGGAAELLNLKPTTVEYRMDKLGIKRVNSVE